MANRNRTKERFERNAHRTQGGRTSQSQGRGLERATRGESQEGTSTPAERHEATRPTATYLGKRNAHTKAHAAAANSGAAERPEGVEAPLEETCFQAEPESAICVQSLDGSLNSAIRTTYRISLRSSSLREPRYPSAGVV